MTQPFKAAIRAGSLKSIGTGRGSIAAAESHAKRLDPVAQSRVVIESDPVAWSKAGGPLDYVEAFKAHKRETGAGERRSAGLAIEFKAVVSPDWLAEGGANPRDPENPRVRQLVAEARIWAESWGGKGAVWAVRYDTDEKGAGVVDVFMSPVREQAHKSGKARAVISCRKAKAELLEAERALDPDLKTSGAAMQSSWARWCGQRLDARIERGQSRELTGRDHVHAEVYAREADRAHLEVYEDACREAEQILADARAERWRATQEAVEARRATERAQEALRASQEAQEAALDAQRAAEATTRALRAEIGKLEEEKFSLSQFVRALSRESVRLNMALHYAENYASSFRAGLASIFQIDQAESVWTRLMEFWRTDAAHNPEAAPKPDQDVGTGNWLGDAPEPEPALAPPPPRRFDGPGW